MRWPNPKLGDCREVRGFLWLPMTLNGETRWLETASWREVYGRSFFGWEWIPRNWTEKEPKR